MNPSPPIIEIHGDDVTVEASYLAARLGRPVDRLRAEMRRGVIYSVVERGEGRGRGAATADFPLPCARLDGGGPARRDTERGAVVAGVTGQPSAAFGSRPRGPTTAFDPPGCQFSVRMGEHRARKEFAVLVLVEPGAFDVEEAKPGEPGEREGIDGELRERAVGAGVGLVVEDMHRAVADLQKIDMAGDGLVGRRSSGKSRMPWWRSSAVMSARVSQIGTSTATVTESLASMKRCSVSWRR